MNIEVNHTEAVALRLAVARRIVDLEKRVAEADSETEAQTLKTWNDDVKALRDVYNRYFK